MQRSRKKIVGFVGSVLPDQRRLWTVARRSPHKRSRDITTSLNRFDTMKSDGLLPCNTYAGGPLDRLNNFRKTDALLQRAQRSHKAQCVVLDPQYRVLSSSGALQYYPMQELDALKLGRPLMSAFLGDWHRGMPRQAQDVELERPIFAVQVSASDVDRIPSSMNFDELRALSQRGTLSMEDQSIAAQARSLAEFHAAHQFCGRCGGRTLPEEGGTRRRCERNPHGEKVAEGDTKACRGMWFPRSDPVVIAIVVTRERCLLGRRPGWRPGLHSALAGFMEHAESCEDTVRREIFEEAGIRVGRCRYHSSQPWPFPYSLMQGFVAEALSEDITVDKNELESAQWFTVDAIRNMLAEAEGTTERLPPPLAIAHHLIASFARRDPIVIFDPFETKVASRS